MKRLSGLLIGLLGVAGLVGFVVLMGSLVYPGALKWTAGTVCPSDRPDPVVVRDTYQVQPGETSTNFTLYCIGERGEIDEAGFGKPVGVLILWAIALVCIPLLLLWLVGTVRRLVNGQGRGGGPEPPGDLSAGTDAFVTEPLDDYGGQPPLIT